MGMPTNAAAGTSPGQAEAKWLCHRFDAAKVAVDQATAIGPWKFVAMLLSLGCTAVLLLGGIIGLAIAGLADRPLFLGVAIVASVLPFLAGIVNMWPRTTREEVLDGLSCPSCGSETRRVLDAEVAGYVLLCQQCRVIWETGVKPPGSFHDDGALHHHHHHHHHF